MGGVTLFAVTGGSLKPLPPTAADGTLRLGQVSCGPLILKMWPLDLADARARFALAAQGGDPSARMVKLKNGEVQPGEQTLEVVAPLGSGY